MERCYEGSILHLVCGLLQGSGLSSRRRHRCSYWRALSDRHRCRWTTRRLCRTCTGGQDLPRHMRCAPAASSATGRTMSASISNSASNISRTSSKGGLVARRDSDCKIRILSNGWLSALLVGLAIVAIDSIAFRFDFAPAQGFYKSLPVLSALFGLFSWPAGIDVRRFVFKFLSLLAGQLLYLAYEPKSDRVIFAVVISLVAATASIWLGRRGNSIN